MALFNHIHETMVANPNLLEKDYEAGVQRVLDEDGKYAFFMESVALDYYLTQHCELRRLGSDIARTTYSIATTPGEQWQ
jgi:ionotropic kainate glutamate receptor 2